MACRGSDNPDFNGGEDTSSSPGVDQASTGHDLNGSPKRLGVNRRRRRSLSRVAGKHLNGRGAKLPPWDHPALAEARTLYPATVRREADVNRALKSGFNSSKIGAVVHKGRWAGLPVYSLTLEERATCPTSCRHWRSCYGNGTYQAERLAAGPDLERRLELELAELASSHPAGFVVRLHVLGDFYSVAYVEFWARMLDRHPAMRVFGYSARWQDDDPIALALAELVRGRWDTFAIRLSNAPLRERTTVSVEHPIQVPPGAVLCPAQVGRTESCTTCALCWQTVRPIAFLQH